MSLTPASWPSQLQDFLNEDGFSFKVGETTIRSENQTGPVKVRRTSTKSVDLIECTIDLTTAQYSIFYDYFDITLNGGVRPFYFVHPISGETKVFRFTSSPSIRSIGGGYFRASMSWEILP